MWKSTKRRPLTKILTCLARIKSVTESVYSSIVECYTGFCEETTLHGLRFTGARNLHAFERLLWLLITAGAFTGAVLCGLAQYSRYTSEGGVVSLRRGRGWWAPFPAVTACFVDRVDVAKARRLIEDTWNVTEKSEPDKYEYYLGFVRLVGDVAFRTNLQNFWKYQTDETVRGLDLRQMALDVHPNIPLAVASSLDDSEVIWIPVMTEVGVCATINSPYAQHQLAVSELAWAGGELMRCHTNSGECYVAVESVGRALRFFVHSPFDILSAISNPTGDVEPGDQLTIDYKMVEIQASSALRGMAPAQRRCRYPDEWLSDSIQAYSFGLCQMHCRTRMALMFCGCRPFFYVKGGKGFMENELKVTAHKP